MFVRYRPAVLAGLLGVLVVGLLGCGKRPAAVVNGTPIPKERFYGILEQVHGGPLMAQLISEELILQEAAKEQAMPEPAEVDRRFQDLKQADPTLLQSLSEAEGKRQLTLTLAVRNLALKGITVEDAEVKKTFEENKEQFDQPESVLVRRAVFKTREEAETARTTLKKAGVQFSVIMDRSIDFDEVRRDRGLLPRLIRTEDAQNPVVFLMLNPQTGQQVAESADALLGRGVAEKLFGMPEKHVTDVLPCENPKGFQVIQIEEHAQAKKATFEDWKERIEEQLLLEKRFKDERLAPGIDPLAHFRADLVNKLRRDAEISVGIEKLKDVPNRPEVWPNLEGATQ